MTKRLLLLAVLLTLVASLSTVVNAPVANAIPPLNPICWIADKNNAAVKENCKGHNWSWPHWGGFGGQDGPNRGCGNGPIMASPYWLDAARLRDFSNANYTARYGIGREQLVLVKTTRHKLRFRPDYVIYQWQAKSEYWIDYGDGTFQERNTVYYPYDGATTNVKCDVK